MLPQEIVDKIQAESSVPYDYLTKLRGAEIAYTHQQEAFVEWSAAQQKVFDEMEAKYQRAMEQLERLYTANTIAYGVPKSEVADLFTEYKTKHDL